MAHNVTLWFPYCLHHINCKGKETNFRYEKKRRTEITTMPKNILNHGPFFQKNPLLLAEPKSSATLIFFCLEFQRTCKEVFSQCGTALQLRIARKGMKRRLPMSYSPVNKFIAFRSDPTGWKLGGKQNK